MADTPARYVPNPKPPILTPGRRPTPSPAVARAAVVAARSQAAGPAPHPTVYQPWGPLLAQADARYKAEINDAVGKLERSTQQAGTILDTAAATAAEAAGHLESAAWAAWHKYMAAAEDTRNAVMGPALTAYEQAIGYARDAYARSLASAEAAYKSIVADAQRAQGDAKSIVA